MFAILVHTVTWRTTINPAINVRVTMHLSGKPGNVREFDSCRGNVRDFTESQGIVRGKLLSGKSYLKLFIVNCIFVSIQVFSRSLLCLKC